MAAPNEGIARRDDWQRAKALPSSRQVTRRGRVRRESVAMRERWCRDLRFQVTVTPANDAYIVGVNGEIDFNTSAVMGKALSKLIDRGRCRLVVNLENVPYIDSTGLGILVGALKRLRTSSGSLSIVCTRPHITRVLVITGLAKILDLFTDEQSALAS